MKVERQLIEENGKYDFSSDGNIQWLKNSQVNGFDTFVKDHSWRSNYFGWLPKKSNYCDDETLYIIGIENL